MASGGTDLFDEVGTVKGVLESIQIQSMVDANRIYEMLEACEETGERRIHSIVQMILQSMGMEDLNPLNDVEIIETVDKNNQDVQTISDSNTDTGITGVAQDMSTLLTLTTNAPQSQGQDKKEEQNVIYDGEFSINSPILPGANGDTAMEDVGAGAEVDMLYDCNNNDPNNNTEFVNMEDRNIRLDAGEGTSGTTKGMPPSRSCKEPGSSVMLSDDEDEPLCQEPFQAGILRKPFSKTTASVCTSVSDCEMGDDVFVDAESLRRQLLIEARNISNVLPDYSVAEVYSYLEANIDNPNRVQAVLKEFLGMTHVCNQSAHSVSFANKVKPNEHTKEVSPETVEVAACETAFKSDVPNTRPLAPAALGSAHTGVAGNGSVEASANAEKASPSTQISKSVEVNLDANPTKDGFEKQSIPNTRVRTIDMLIDEETKETNEADLVHRKRHSSDISESDGAVEPDPVEGKRVRLEELEDQAHLPEVKQPTALSKEVQRSISYVLELFPDASYNYIAEECNRCNGDNVQVQALVDRLLDGDYPRRVATVLSNVHDEQPGASQELPKTPDQILFDNYKTLLSIFPDTDPEYLQSMNKNTGGDDAKFKEFLASALEGNIKMPSRREYEKRQEDEEMKRKYMNESFNVQEFLEIFEDPDKYFSDENRRVPDEYCKHVYAFLLKEFTKVPARTIQMVMKKHHQRLTPSYHDLQKYAGPFNKSHRHAWDISTPNNSSLQFLQEVAYVTHIPAIRKYIEDKKGAKELAYAQARIANDLLQCGCCYDDQLIIEDMASCSEGHLFCKECIQKSTEIGFGDGKTIFQCLGPDCEAEFTLQTLQIVLKKKVFSRLVQKRQAEEVRAAGIEDLESCPFCDYATILPQTDHIFKCLNPECMIDSCRLCKERNHIPLRCDEVEHENEVKARTYIEDKMTEALVRTCWKCQKKFVKEDGCNKMTCTCGALMCYVCRKPVKDYSHFRDDRRPGNSTQCPLYSDNRELHFNNVQQVAEKAKAEILENNPNLQLKHDPTQVLPPEPPKQRVSPRVAPDIVYHQMVRGGEIIAQVVRGMQPVVMNMGVPRPPVVIHGLPNNFHNQAFHNQVLHANGQHQQNLQIRHRRVHPAARRRKHHVHWRDHNNAPPT